MKGLVYGFRVYRAQGFRVEGLGFAGGLLGSVLRVEGSNLVSRAYNP